MHQQDETLAASPRPAVSVLGGLAQLRAFATRLIAPGDDRARAQSNALIAFAVRVVSAALLYVMQIVLARWMGGFEYGIYVFVWTWVLILGGLAPLGLNMAVMRLASEYTERKQPARLRGLTFGSRLVAVVVGTAIMLVGCAGLYAFSPLISSYYVLPAYLALVCVPLYALGDTQDGLGRGQAWMASALVPPYIVRPVLILGFMFVAHNAGLPMDATTAAGAAILGTWITSLVQMLILNRKYRAALQAMNAGGDASREKNRVSVDAGREFETARWFTISAPFLVASACELLLQNGDILIISQFLSPEHVGVYFAAAKTMSLILFVHYAVGSAVANRFSALSARGDKEGLKAYVGDALNWTFWPSLAAAGVLLALGRPLLSLFGPQFATEGYPVMFILAAGFLLRSAVGPAEFLLNMLGEQRLCAAVLVATAVLNVGLNVALVPMFGLIGAACATATSLSVGAIALYVAVRQRLGLELAIWKSFKTNR